MDVFQSINAGGVSSNIGGVGRHIRVSRVQLRTVNCVRTIFR